MGQRSGGTATRPRRWRISERTAWTDRFDRAVVLPTGSETTVPFALEGSAYMVWSVLFSLSQATAEDVTMSIAEELEVEPGEVRDDILRLLAELHAAGAIVQVADG